LHLGREGLDLHVFGSSLRQKRSLQKFISQQKLANKSTVLSLPPSIWPTLWYKLNWPPIETLIGKTDVFHAWEELIPPVKNTPVVATIHDLAILKFPETAHPSTLVKHHEAWKRLCSIDGRNRASQVRKSERSIGSRIGNHQRCLIGIISPSALKDNLVTRVHIKEELGGIRGGATNSEIIGCIGQIGNGARVGEFGRP
jgi:hypothetical protein